MSVLVGQQAPEFTAAAVMADGSINESFSLSDYEGKYVVLFFYPLDFTFVCPSELIAFDHRIAEFEARGVQVIGCSVDSHFSHAAWRNTAVNDGSYDVLLDGGVALRGSFLIDKDGTIRHAVINDLPLGRNIDEMIRMVDAMLFTNEHGEVCAAGWNKGDEGMKADN